MNKADLIERIAARDRPLLIAELLPTWWQRYYNHAYGGARFIGALLAIAQLIYPLTFSGKNIVALSENESPIRFQEFAHLSLNERDAFVSRHRGKPVVWQGSFVEPIGFEYGSRMLPVDEPVGIRIIPSRGDASPILVDCEFGVLGYGDSGVDTAARLVSLDAGKRLRILGILQGNGKRPILQEARLIAELDVNE